jgi:hypothetical protein
MSENRKSIPLSSEARGVIECQLVAFQKKFGREPGLTDPIFFDPDSDKLRPTSQQTQEEDERGIVEAMATAGIDPALIYAFKKTGRIVIVTNKRLLSEQEIAEWEDAIDEYHLKVDAGEIV